MDNLASKYRAGGIAVKVDARLLPPQLMIWEGTHNVPLSSYAGQCLPISQAFCSGEQATITLRTKAGFELTCTPDHRVMSDRGWVAAADLRINEDRVWIQGDPGAFNQDPSLPVAIEREFRGKNGRSYPPLPFRA